MSEAGDDTKPLEGQIVHVEEQVPPQALALYDAADAGLILERAAKQADGIMKLVRDKRLAINIHGREYLPVEVWTAIATSNGKRLDVLATQTTGDRESEDFVASACVGLRDVRTGEIVQRAWASVSRKENNWKSRDAFAIESMAQTRAAGKVARLAYGWIVAMAGFKPTPAEEMTREESLGGDPISPDALALIAEIGPTKQQDKTTTMRWLAEMKYRGWDDFTKRGDQHALAFIEYLNTLPDKKPTPVEKKQEK